jgi:hypothetical protein
VAVESDVLHLHLRMAYSFLSDLKLYTIYLARCITLS